MGQMVSAGVFVKNNVYFTECSCGFKGLTTGKCQKCHKKVQVLLKKDETDKCYLKKKTKTEKFITYTFDYITFNSWDKFKKEATPFELIFDIKKGKTTLVEKITDEKTDLSDGQSYYGKLPIFTVRYTNNNVINEIEWLIDAPFIKDFLKDAFKERNIQYKKVEDYLKDGELLQTAFILLHYPVLQHFPSFKIKSLPKTEALQEGLKNSHSSNDVWKLLTGSKSKTIKKLATNETRLNFLIFWGEKLKRPESFEYLIKTLNGKERIKDYKMIRNFNELCNPELVYKAIDFISNIYEDETLWLRKVRKLVSDRYQTEEELLRILTDIGRMLNVIEKDEPDYKPASFLNIITLHDELSFRMKTGNNNNTVYHYDDKTKELEKVIDQYEFILVPDSYSLVNAGREMRICVGSYHYDVVNKECIIVFVKKDNKLEACIEITNDEIVQAKTSCNHLPEGNLKDAILTYAKKSNLKINTFDL
jgi:hypothetical protein